MTDIQPWRQQLRVFSNLSFSKVRKPVACCIVQELVLADIVFKVLLGITTYPVTQAYYLQVIPPAMVCDSRTCAWRIIFECGEVEIEYTYLS